MGLHRCALVLAVSAVAAIAQSPTADFFGEIRLTLTSGADRFEACQIKSPYANSTGYNLVLRSLAGGVSDPPEHVLTMPYDEPRAAYKMGPGTFLVSGRDTVNDIAYLCHVSMDTSSSPAQLVLQHASPQPLSACHAIAYNATEQVVYALDILTQAVVAAPWVEASPLPLLISSVDLSVLGARPGLWDLVQPSSARLLIGRTIRKFPECLRVPRAGRLSRAISGWGKSVVVYRHRMNLCQPHLALRWACLMRYTSPKALSRLLELHQGKWTSSTLLVD